MLLGPFATSDTTPLNVPLAQASNSAGFSRDRNKKVGGSDKSIPPKKLRVAMG